MDIDKVAAELGCSSDSSITYLLFEALYKRRKDILRALLEYNKPLVDSINNSSNKTPLGVMAETGNFDICIILLDFGCCVNKKDDSGWTALHYAAAKGHEQIVQLLLQRGANPNSKTPYRKYNLLHITVLQKHLHLVPCLRSLNIRLNSKDSCGRTVLDMAVDEGLEKEAFAAILDLETNVNKRYKDLETPLLRATKANNIVAMRELIKRGANINFQDSRGKSPLYIATENQHVSAIKILFQQGLPSSYNAQLLHPTALHFAFSKEYDKSILRLLVSNKIEIDISNTQGLTPLMIAVRLNNSEAVRILIQAGADTFTGDAMGDNAVFTALSNKNWEILADLIEESSYVLSQSQDILRTAIELHNINFVDALIKNGEIIRDTHVDLAIRSKNNDIMKIIMNNFEINQREKDYKSVFNAVTLKLSEVLCKLLVKGANPDYYQPLCFAAYNNCIEEIKILIKFKADVDLILFGYPPLWFAVERCNLEAIDLLLAANCDPNFINSSNSESILQRAVMKSKTEIVELLLRYGATPSKEKDELLDAVLLKQLSIVKMLVKNGAKILNHHMEISRMCSEEIQDFLSKKENLFTDLGKYPQICLLKSDANYIILKGQTNFSLKIFVEELQTKGIFIRLLDCALETHRIKNVWYGQSYRRQTYTVKLLFFDYAKVFQHDKEIEQMFNSCQKPISDRYYVLVPFKPGIIFSHEKDNSESFPRNLRLYHYEGKPPISIQNAAFEGNLEYLIHLINNGKDVNAVDDFGRSSLHWAVLGNHANIVSYLINAKADIQKKDKESWTSLSISVYNDFDEITQLLLAAGAEVHAIDFRRACRCGNISAVKKMMEQYKITEHHLNDINAIRDEQAKKEIWRHCIQNFNKYGNNVALFVTLKKKLHHLKTILNYDANLVNSQNIHTGISILHMAIDYEYDDFKEILKLLEEFDCNLDLFCKLRGETALYKAIRLKRIDKARLLIVAKANFSLGSELSGISALQLAINKRMEDLVELMMNAGETPHTSNCVKSWPRKMRSLENLALITIRKSIQQIRFRRSVNSLHPSSFIRNILLLNTYSMRKNKPINESDKDLNIESTDPLEYSTHKFDQDDNNLQVMLNKDLCACKKILNIDPNPANNQKFHMALTYKYEEFKIVPIFLEKISGDLDVLYEDRRETALFKEIRIVRIDKVRLFAIAKADCPIGSELSVFRILQLARYTIIKDVLKRMMNTEAIPQKSWPQQKILMRISFRNSSLRNHSKNNIESLYSSSDNVNFKLFDNYEISNNKSSESLKYFTNYIDQDGNNVALRALLNTNLFEFKKVLKTDVNLANSQNIYTGMSILHMAIVYTYSEFSEILMLLKELGGNLDLFCYDRKETALYRAIRFNRIDKARLLVTSKADCSIGSNSSGFSALQLAVNKDLKDLVKLMINAGTIPKMSKNSNKNVYTNSKMLIVKMKNVIRSLILLKKRTYTRLI